MSLVLCQAGAGATAQAGAQTAAQATEELGRAADFLAQQLPFYALACLFAGGLAALIHYKLLRPQLLQSSGADAARPAVWLLGSGVVLALLLLFGTVLPGLLGGGFNPGLPGYQPYALVFAPGPAPGAGLIWLFFIAQGSFEELLFRGIGMALLALLIAWTARTALGFDAASTSHGRLWFWSGLSANLVLGLAFGYVHAGNAHATPFAIVNVALAGLALGQLYWLQRSLWGACSLHIVWNAGQTMLGLPVSGYLLSSPLVGSIAGAQPGLLTGGQFGPEASLPCTAGLLSLWLWLLWQCWRGGRKQHSTTGSLPANAPLD